MYVKMSIERAKADLAQARIEAQRLAEQARSVAERVAKLEVYLEMARVYEADCRVIAATAAPGARGRPTMAQAATQIIRESGKRQTTRELIDALEQHGYVIGGENKVTNLSSTLSRCEALVANKVEGWGLVEWVTPPPVLPDEEIKF